MESGSQVKSTEEVKEIHGKRLLRSGTLEGKKTQNVLFFCLEEQ